MFLRTLILVAAAALIGGGTALYLAGLSLFRFALGFADPLPRAVTAQFVPMGRVMDAEPAPPGVTDSAWPAR